MIPEFIFFRATSYLICVIESFSTHYYSTTSRPHSVVNFHVSFICYIRTIIFHPLLQYNISSAFSRQLTRITHLLHTYHYYSTTSHPHSVVNLHASLICYILTIISTIITVQHLICIQSSTYTHHSSATYLPLLQYNISSAFSRQLTRITHLLHTVIPLLQYHISSTFSRHLTPTTHLLHTYY